MKLEISVRKLDKYDTEITVKDITVGSLWNWLFTRKLEPTTTVYAGGSTVWRKKTKRGWVRCNAPTEGWLCDIEASWELAAKYLKLGD